MGLLTLLPLRGTALALGAALGLATLAGQPAPATAADLDYPPSLKDEPYDRYGDRPEYEERYRETRARVHDDCVPREVVRRRLHADGWSDFEVPEPRGAYVVVDARRPNGRLFSLRIDRCSGEVVLARPLDPPRRFERWAARDEWRDWGGRHWRRPGGWGDDRPYRY